MLELPAPRLNGYSRETVIAEKFEAMVKLGIVNSRMKDFYDIWLLSRKFDFTGPLLSNAVKRTFANRKTEIFPTPLALTPVFATDVGKQIQWQAFLRKSSLVDAPVELQDIVAGLGLFLLPVAKAIVAEKVLNQTWEAPGPWKQ